MQKPPSTAWLRAASIALALALTATFACAGRGCRSGDDYRGVACRAADGRAALRYGLSRDAAIDTLGRAQVEPPWANALGIGPPLIENPYDSRNVESPIGEEYEIVRFFVEATGNPDCPFVQGELRFQPLIFVEGELVGWSWSYLSDVLGRRLSPKETRWSFGAFCDGRRVEPEAETPMPSD